MTASNRPGVAFWATVVVVAVLVLYPLSWGPACWIRGCLGNAPWALQTYWLIYDPIYWLDQRSPECVQNATTWYCGLLYPDGPGHRRTRGRP